MSLSFIAYIKRKWWKVMGHFFLLMFPIIAGLWIVLESPGWISSFTVFYEDNNTIYIINTVFIIFVFMSLIPVLVNMVFCLISSSEQINEYKGSHKSIKNIHIISILLIVLLGGGISIFLAALIWSIYADQQVLKLNDIVWCNGRLSILIFFIFLVMDTLAWRCGKIMDSEQKNSDKSFIIKKSAQESILFVDLPTVLIVSLSVFFLSKLGDIDYFKSFLSSPHVFLKPVTVLLQSNQKEVIELFPNGIETGIIMTSIIYSQILYFILKIKWDYMESRYKS